MDQWIRPIIKFGTTALISVSGLISGLLICILLYIIWNYGTITFIGIPLQLILVTIIFPILLAGILFWLARRVELLARQSDDG